MNLKLSSMRFRVARNIPVGNTHLVFKWNHVFWISSNSADDVDGFAPKFKNVTREKRLKLR
jgi:hypothetical protein